MYNGYTKSISIEEKIENLIAQIPQEYRARACRECYGADDFELERNLTSYVLFRKWETYTHPVDEAQEIERWLDSLTPSQRDFVTWVVSDDEVDTGLNTGQVYRPASNDGDIPF